MAGKEKDSKNAGIGCLVLLALIGGFALWVASLPEREVTPAEAARDRLYRAMVRCENETKDRVADPGGFEAESYGAWRVEPGDSPDKMTFMFTARAKNAYGALVWGDFTCRATYDGKYWTAEISVDGG